jgi:hypothetical protein
MNLQTSSDNPALCHGTISPLQEKEGNGVKALHLFEFMDQAWLPGGLRATLHDILECSCSRPFRSYYKWVAHEVARLATARGFRHIVELGAGSGPISRLLARDPSLNGISLVVCDSHPDAATYGDLEKRYPGRIFPIYEPVDFSKPRSWPPKTLLLLSGTFHHVPPAARPQVLASLTASGTGVVIAEPLRKTLSSLLFVLCSTVPALLLPLWFFPRPGKLRRFLWCWLLPVAPLIFWWEGEVSCLRMWSEREWSAGLQNLLSPGRKTITAHTTFCRMVVC